MSDLSVNFSSQKDLVYDFDLDDTGVSSLTTDVIKGELRAIIFKLPNDLKTLGGIKVSMSLDGYNIVLMNDLITNDFFYILKFQPSDGFGQVWSMSNEYPLLNDKINVKISGVPFGSVRVTFRYMEV